MVEGLANRVKQWRFDWLSHFPQIFLSGGGRGPFPQPPENLWTNVQRGAGGLA